MSEVLIIKRDNGEFVDWANAFANGVDDLEVRAWEARGEFPAAEVDYALVWQPEPGALAAMPNLREYFLIGIGVSSCAIRHQHVHQKLRRSGFRGVTA